MAPMQDERGEVTRWLEAVQGEQGAAPALAPLYEKLYGELRALASRQLRQEAAGHTLSATALSHEAWFRLAEQGRTRWRSRGHFLAVAATMMRRILVNHALARQAEKRAALLVTLSQGLGVADDSSARDVVRVHEALLAFEAVDPRAAQVVELRYFGGLEVGEIAQALGTSPATVQRDWVVAKAWLHRALAGG